MTYDSRPDTEEHIKRVSDLLYMVRMNVQIRSAKHDQSKLEEPEKSVFDAVTPKLRTLTYGSDEYKVSLEEMGEALRHHYAHNSHHPEHYPQPETDEIKNLKIRIARLINIAPRSGKLKQARRELGIIESGANGMSLLDLIEMLCDWKAATERHTDGDLRKSLEINKTRFGLSDQLHSILTNTAKELGFI